MDFTRPNLMDQDARYGKLHPGRRILDGGPRTRSCRRAVAPRLEDLEARTLLSFVAGPDPHRADPAPAVQVRSVPGEVLVRFEPGATEAQRADARGGAGAALRERIETGPGRGNGHGAIERLDLPPGLSVEAAIRALERHPAVDLAEPNWIYTIQSSSNDPYYTDGSLWGMYGDATSPGNPYGSQAGEAWAAGHIGSSTVYVGVIDEGIDITHPDLAANIWTNPYDLAGDGIDNDSNGYVDDVNGWDFFNGDATVYDGSEDNHGTHVAGTIAAVGGNGLGVSGVSWRAQLISAKFLGPDGGSTLDAIRAIDYFVDLKTRHGLNIVALNNSWGGGGYSRLMEEAIIRAAKAEILFVAAAGNGGADRVGDNNDLSPSWPSNYTSNRGTPTEGPASYDSVIAVAAIDSSGRRAGFSNYGPTTVDLGAPGVGIVSTVPGGGYGSYSGTSMATPHVTGAIALYAAASPGARAAAIRAAILDTGAPTSALAGLVATGGRLDASGALAGLPPSVPSQAYTLDRDLGLFSDGDLYENSGGRGEKWMQGGGGQWYFILPDGGLYRWDAGGGATGALVATLDPFYHEDPRRLYDAPPEGLATQLDRDLGLFSDGELYENSGGRGEKWMQGGGGQWYFILADGGLYRWDAGGGATGALVATLDASYHARPPLLYSAYA